MTTPTDYPDRVRALLEAARSGPWIAGTEQFRPAVFATSGSAVDVPIADDIEDHATAALIAEAPTLARAYLDAIAERDALRADSPPPADAELLALANRTLAADLAKVRADRDRLARILAVEQGDDSAGNPPSGWSHGLDLTEDAGAIIRHVWTGPPGEVYGSPHEGWRFTRTRGLYRENQPFHETALEAMEAADRAAGGSNV